MITKKVNYKKKFIKFLSDNDLLTEFNRNFKNKEASKQRLSFSPIHRNTYFAIENPESYLMLAFIWSDVPEDFQIWADLNWSWKQLLQPK